MTQFSNLNIAPARRPGENSPDGSFKTERNFWKRDPRFANVDRHRERFRKDLREYNRKHKAAGNDLLRPNRDFTMSEDQRYCICPAGRRLYRNGGNVVVRGQRAIKFRGAKRDCRVCEIRQKCLRCPESSEVRQVYFFQGLADNKPETFAAKMRRKIDTITGRLIYSRRLAIAESPFAHIRSILRLDRFSLRGKRKVNTQWLLCCIMHNLTEVHRYGLNYA